jgi:hypothetical protein
MKERDKKCRMIQCKISSECYARIEKLVELGRFASLYEWMQYVISVVLRVLDPMSEGVDEYSNELLTFAKAFEGWENEKRRIITTRPSGNKNLKLTDSINVYSEVGRMGYTVRALQLRGEEMKVTSNTYKAVDILIKKLLPKNAEALSEIGKTIGEDSLMRVVEYLATETERKGVESKGNALCVEIAANEYGNVPKKKRSKSLYDE